MSISFNKHLVKVLAEVAIFLEFTNEDLLNQDVAIEMMEQIGAELQLMSQDDKLVLSSTFDEISNEFTNSLHKNFVKNLIHSLGISD